MLVRVDASRALCSLPCTHVKRLETEGSECCGNDAGSITVGSRPGRCCYAMRVRRVRGISLAESTDSRRRRKFEPEQHAPCAEASSSENSPRRPMLAPLNEAYCES